MASQEKYYPFIWRWHFYSGLFVFPILLIMAVTGGMYLLQPQIEGWMYGNKLYIHSSLGNLQDHDKLIEKAKLEFKAKKIHSYQPSQEAGRSAEVVLTTSEGEKITVFVDPSNAQILGSVNEKWRLMNIAKGVHGGLMIGRFGEIVVELVACWTLMLLITGFYLWWPRKIKRRGVFVPMLKNKGRNLWREFHAVPGAWIGIWIFAIILTGLPWSSVWGDLFSKAGHALHQGFPKAIFEERPVSVSDETLPDISMNALMEKIETLDIHHAYKIEYPWFEKGVYAVMPLRHGGNVGNLAFVFLDKRSGEVLKDLRWEDLGAFGQITSVGIQLHEGRLFGTLNQFLNLMAVLTLISFCISGPVMWWKRRPEKGLGAPTVPADFKISHSFAGLLIFMMIFLPLFGASILLILVAEVTYKKLKRP